MHVWDLASGHVEKITRVYGHANEQRSFESFRISPDGAYIALEGSARKGGGVINILAADSMQWVAQARVESIGGMADFAWWRNSGGLCIVGKNGEVTEWNLHDRAAVARWKDDGAVGTTTLALGGDSGRKHLGGDRWVAIGSSSGIVNIYDRRTWLPPTADEPNNGVPPNPKPTRTLDQLVTPISHLTFDHDGQVLCMASKWKADALRLVHLPSCTVYRNWPTGKTPLGRVSAVAWGQDAERGLCLLVGNERGALRGWEVRG
jgi:U3 small nucleolar RNA-associated protein 18